MSYFKNLTAERKGTFSSLDITGKLNIDNGRFLSSGNMISSGIMSASYADYEELYANRFCCNQASFNLMVSGLT